MMFTLGILIAGLLTGSALTAGIGGPEESPLEPVTDLGAATFAISAAIGLIAVVAGVAAVRSRSSALTRSTGQPLRCTDK
jgi:hypothetical protein